MPKPFAQSNIRRLLTLWNLSNWNRTMIGICLMIAIASFASRCVALDDAAEREARLVDVRDGLSRTVRDTEQKANFLDTMPTTRDLVNAGVAKFVLEQDTSVAEALILKAFKTQEMNSGSLRYGLVPWQVGHPEIVDSNAIEFSTQGIGPLWVEFGSKLSPEFKESMLTHIKAAFEALRKHDIPVSYTNMFLMKAVNLILMGEAVKDAAAASDGYALLDQWMEYTKVCGIHEFDSPTYYGVDLNSLNMGYRYAASPEERVKFKAALDFFWTEIAVNVLPKREQLVGAHSRDYDFVRGTGGLDAYLFVEGLRRDHTTERLDLEKTYLLLNGDDRGYHPSTEIRKLASIPERVVRQRWDTAPEKDRYSYITPYFSVGGANGTYGPQDKVTAIDYASPKALPSVSIVTDSTDQPYGKNRFNDKQGHPKPVHVASNPTIIQEKGVQLVLLDIDASKSTPSESLATNVLLPLEVDSLQIGGEGIDPANPSSRPISLETLTTIREGTAGTVIRILRMDACGTEVPSIQIRTDKTGLKSGAARLTIYHHKGQMTPLKEAHIKVAILFVTAVCADDATLAKIVDKVKNAVYEEKIGPTTWEASVKLDTILLEAGKDLSRRATLYRKVNGHDITPPPVLEINGVDKTGLLGAMKVPSNK